METCLKDIFKTCFQDPFEIYLEDVLETKKILTGKESISVCNKFKPVSDKSKANPKQIHDALINAPNNSYILRILKLQ